MRKGYSPRLRHLHRSKRIHLGYLEETFSGDKPRAHLLKAPSKDQKGDLLTKEMSGPRFEECKQMLGIVPMACILPERPAKMLICIGGHLKPVSECLAEITLISQCSDASLHPGLNSWVIDSGSGRHLVCRSVLDENASKHIVKVDEPLKLSTANGVVTTNEKVKIYVQGLDVWLMAWVLEETPLVISINSLIEEHSYEFTMKRHRDKTTAFLKKGSKKIALPVILGVPVLAA